MSISENREIHSKKKSNPEKFMWMCEMVGEVFIYDQEDHGQLLSDTNRYVLCFVDTDYWVDTYKTISEAVAAAKSLGLEIS